jgi:acyl carrier protein
MLSDNRRAIVLNILAREFDVPVEKLDSSVSLIADLGADSLSLINVMMQVEESLHIEVPEEEWRSVDTVGDILAKLERLPATVPTQSVK